MKISIMIAMILIVIVAAILAKNTLEKKKAEEERQRKIAEEEVRQRRIQQEKEEQRLARLAEKEAGSDIYHYMNQSIKTMFYYYRTEQWEQMTTFGENTSKDPAAAKRCIDKLSADCRQVVKEFMECIALDETFSGTGEIKDSKTLKQVFEHMMLPFLPLYYREFSRGPRYISFMNQKILKVFSQLSGKKFRVGYKNKYQNGQPAFEWSNPTYRVFAEDGTELCHASFKNGTVENGYLILKQPDASTEDWEVSRKEYWKNGALKQEDTHYIYKKIIG